MKLRVPGQKLYIDFQRNFIHNYNDVNLFLIISKEKTKTVSGKDSVYLIVCQIYDFKRVLLEILGSWSFFLLIPRDNL
jgi:hypothetical protein